MKHKTLLIIPIFIMFILLLGCNGSNKEKNTEQLLENQNIEEEETPALDNESSLQKTKKKNDDKKTSKDDWYWNNTIVSSGNQFSEWSGGTAEISMGYRLKSGDRENRMLNIGIIDSEGKIQIKLPAEVGAESSLNKMENILFFDIQDISSLTYTNGDTGYFANASFLVTRNGQNIGNLTLGNSVKVTHNLTNQSMLTAGDEGYILYWAYVENDCSLQAAEAWKGKVRRDGTNTLEVETNVHYNLDFKAGWNLVKTEVIGKYNLEHERGLNASWFKSHIHTIINEMPNDANYFFRTPQKK